MCVYFAALSLLFSLHYNKKLFTISRDKAINFHQKLSMKRVEGKNIEKEKVEKIQFIFRKILLFLHRHHEMK